MRSTRGVTNLIVLIFMGATLFADPAAAQRLITTVVGRDWLPSVEGLQAKDLPLSAQMRHVTVDRQGNLYIPDPFSFQVFRIGTDGIVHVAAGNGIAGYTGDGGAATSASLNGASSAAVDGNGILYIGDNFNYRIRRVGADGTISTVAGIGSPAFGGDGGPASAASFGPIGCMAFDSANNLFFCDSENNRVRKISAAGIISTVAGNGKNASSGDGGPATAASISIPYGIAIDANGQFYIGEGSSVRRVAVDGTISTFAGNGQAGFGGDGGPATKAMLAFTRGVAKDAAGNVYVADVGNHRIRRIDTAGIITTVAGTGVSDFTGDGGPPQNATLYFPWDVTFDSAGRLLIVDQGNSRIRAVTLGSTIATLAGNGLFRFTPDKTPATQSYLFTPSGVAADASGNLYIGDTNADVIRKVTADSLVQTIFGKPGVTAIAGVNTISSPQGVILASNGDLLIADTGFSRVRRLAPNGTITTVAGNQFGGYSGDGGPAAQAMLNLPTEVAYDAAGRIFIADQMNHRIRVVTNDTITTFAGNGTQASTGDGQQATAASLNQPTGVAVDANGTVYIGEFGGCRIRKVSADGKIATIAGTGACADSGDGGPATAAGVSNVRNLIFDAQGNLYFSQQNPHKVRRINPAGVISTIAGGALTGFSGDGGPSTSAALNQPTGLAIGGDGTIYIADAGNNRIRAVLPASAQISISTNQLSFSATSGGERTPQQNIALTASLAGVSFNGLPFTASTDVPWLVVTPNTGTTPSSIGVVVDPDTLGVGTSQAVIRVNAPGASPAQVAINVSATVTTAIPPRLAIDSNQLSFSEQAGAGASLRVVSVSNSGGGVLNVTATATTARGGNWLSVGSNTGQVKPGAPLSLAVTANPANLAAGTYTGKVSISSDQNQAEVAVSLVVTAPQATMVISQTGLTFTGVAQGGTPLPQSFGILNSGSGTMNFTATASTLSGGSNWLSISPTSGTVARPLLDAPLINVSVNTAGLAPGDYYGRIDVTAPSAINSPQTVTVVLNVLPAGSNPGPQVRPSGLIFTGVAGGVKPGSQIVSVGNLTPAPLQYGSSQTYVVPGNWLVNVPSNDTVMPNNPSQIVVQPDFGALPQGISRAFLNLGFSDGSSRTVSVLTVLAPPGSSSPDAREGESTAGGCSPSTLNIILTSSEQSFRASSNQPSTIGAQIVDDCGTALTPDRGGVGVTTSFSNGDPGLNMVHTPQGRWSGSWQPRNTAQSSMRATITAFLILPGGKTLANQLDMNVTLTNGARVPVVTPGKVLNGASFVPETPVAPGSLISIFGSQLADGVALGNAPFQTTLGGTQVVLGGKPAPLLYTSDGQINAQVPFDVPVNSQLQLLIQRGTALSVGDSLTVAPAQPAVFTQSEQGTGQGSIVNGVTNVVADPSASVGAGDVVAIYCTGLGPVDPPVASGAVAPNAPLSRTINDVTVTIGGIPAALNFAGLAPGLAAVYQVNAVVPAGVTAGGSVPVVLTVAGQISPPVTIAVR
jgi:uncharacterized protein (TIGR03437 family)